MTCEATTEKNETLNVDLQSGTVFTSNDGTVLTGDIDLRVVHFSNSSDSSLRLFPGGFNITNYIDENNNLVNDNAVFYSYGFFSIEATDQSGNRASNLSVPASIVADINPGSLSSNSDNSGSLSDGDIIPLWSLDENTGIWKLEESVPYNSATGGVATSISHFSTWNFDSKSDHVCTSLSIPFPTDIIANYSQQINTNGLYCRQVNDLVGAGNGFFVFRTPRGSIALEIVNFPER